MTNKFFENTPFYILEGEESVYLYRPVFRTVVFIVLLIYIGAEIIVIAIRGDDNVLIGLLLYGIFFFLIVVIVLRTDCVCVVRCLNGNLKIMKIEFPFMMFVEKEIEPPFSFEVGRRSVGRNGLVRLLVVYGNEKVYLTRSRVLTEYEANKIVNSINQFKL